MADTTLLEKVLSLQDKFQSLQDQLSSPEVMSDMKKFVQLNKDYKELEPIIAAGKEYEKMISDLTSAKDILVNEKDDELREMAREEIADIEPRLPEMEQKIKLLLIPADPDDGKNAIVEAAPAGTRLPFSLETFSGCISTMPSRRAGSSRSRTRHPVLREASNRWFSSFRAATESMVR